MSAESITVGLCVHDDSQGLLRSVPSALSQAIDRPVRVVVVDQARTDHTSAVLDELARSHRDLEVLRTEQTGDPSSARNRLLEHAGDGYVAWMACGDVWRPRRLERLLDALQHVSKEDHDHVSVAPVRHLDPARGRERLSVFDLDGDQLRSALCGDLAPSFGDLLGPARIFREVGGFDERMGRLRDRDLLIRVLASGRRLTGVGSEDPLQTRVDTGHGPAADDTASDPTPTTAGRALAHKHASLLDHYGRDFSRRCRCRLLVEDARQLERDGRRLRARTTRMRARLLAGADQEARRHRAASGRPRRAGAGAEAGGGGRHPESTTSVPGPGALTAGAARAEDPEGALPGSEPATSAIWRQLAEDHRAVDDLQGAEAVLRDALERHPVDGELMALLAETRLRLHDWHGCASVWARLEHLDRAAISDVTYTVAASAHRMLGEHRRALEISEAGTRAWPQSHRVQKELYRARSSLVDWSSCLHPSPTTPEAGDPPGLVTHLGFLLGGSGGLEGHLAAPASGPVSLIVNDRPVASTHAAVTAHATGTRPPARFTLDCHDLLEYLGDDDILSVEHAGRPLEIEGFGRRLVVHTRYPSRADVLHERLRAGWVFARFGRLRKGHTPRSKREIIGFLHELSAHVEKRVGQPVLPLYGNLLGAIREHDFIAHDVGGFDAGYVSSQASPAAVREEFVHVCRGLLEHGYHLTVNPWCAMVRRRSTDARFIDLNFAWRTPRGELQLSYGWRYPPAQDPAALPFPRHCPLAAHLVQVPGNAEAVLRQIYGPGWVVPDQGFDLDARLVRDVDFLLTETELASLHAEWPTRVTIESVLGPRGEVVSRR